MHAGGPSACRRCARRGSSRQESAVAAERLRIARELHDVLAHSLSGITVQAGVGLHLMDREPEAARRALTEIREASRDALDEVREVLGVLRADGEAPREPAGAPGPRSVTELLVRARADGLTVDDEGVAEAATRVPEPLAGVVHRTLQEALTNVRRHAPGASVQVRLVVDDRIVLEVVDDGPGAARGRRRLRPARHARARPVRRRDARRRTRADGVPGPARAPAGRPMIRVLLADDQALVRGGFRALLDAEPDLTVVGEASTGDEAVRLALELLPDVVLMDIRMPGTDGLTATRRIVAEPRAAGVRVVVVTTFELDEYVTEAIRGGASGFLVKDTEPADLLRAVRVVAAGDALLSPTVTRRLLATVARATREVAEAPALADLTPREREVLVLVAEGLSNDEIGERLFLSPLTVKTHVLRAATKLGARDRAQLVVVAYESGVVRPGWAG